MVTPSDLDTVVRRLFALKAPKVNTLESYKDCCGDV